MPLLHSSGPSCVCSSPVFASARQLDMVRAILVALHPRSCRMSERSAPPQNGLYQHRNRHALLHCLRCGLSDVRRWLFQVLPLITYPIAIAASLCAFVTLLARIWRRDCHVLASPPLSRRAPNKTNQSPTRLYPFFNRWLSFRHLPPLTWAWICLRDDRSGFDSCAGLFFSYRSLHPGSGVSPAVPVLLLLSGWYLWAIFQTARLRFSTMSRPRLQEAGLRMQFPFIC